MGGMGIAYLVMATEKDVWPPRVGSLTGEMIMLLVA